MKVGGRPLERSSGALRIVRGVVLANGGDGVARVSDEMTYLGLEVRIREDLSDVIRRQIALSGLGVNLPVVEMNNRDV